jgi:dihydropteroate synthase
MAPDELNTWLSNPHRPPLVMGVLNFTPDSFSDGGRFKSVSEASVYAEEMVSDGADWIDVGGESTRPGSQPVSPAEQIDRTLPLIESLQGLGIVISIDTTRGVVAEAALDAGATIINDISAGRDDPAMLPLAAARQAPIILVHMQGTPVTMQVAPHYLDVVQEVADFLEERRAAALSAGVKAANILFDPGLGFGKTVSHNVRLMKHTSNLAALGQPLVVGPSRKSFLGKLISESDPNERMYAGAAAVAWMAGKGASVARVHDVRSMAQVLRVIRAIQAEN